VFLFIAVSFNQPIFCPNATWNPNGITFANATSSPFGLYIDINNFVYGVEQGTNRVDIWSKNGTNPIRSLSGNLSSPGGVFVTSNGDIYVDSGNYNRVVKWTANGTSSVFVTNVSSECLGLFIDINNTLYCSMDNIHMITKISLNGGANIQKTIAGNGSSGSAANMLNSPNGIFVDGNLSLYVADWGNNRIQLFRWNQSIGVTVVGSAATGTISLSGPSGVILDGDGYFFIVDFWNNRIVGSSSSGFRCIAGCSTTSGSSPTQLNWPRTVAFDSDGNIYVSDYNNNRIQKFVVMNNSCGEFDNHPF